MIVSSYYIVVVIVIVVVVVGGGGGVCVCFSSLGFAGMRLFISCGSCM